MKNYDFLIVGAGLFGATFAHEATKRGKRCLVIEKRSHVGGNVYTERIEGIDVHVYGPHIFHTDDEIIWNYVNSITPFNDFINSPLAKVGDKYYHLPFNMNTFKAFWGVETAEEAKAKLASERVDIPFPKTIEDQALSTVGRDFYETFIKGYTEKQWGRPCSSLPASILKRIPLRFTYDNNYYNDRYQGVPVNGYTHLIEKMLEGVEVRLNADYFAFVRENGCVADKIVFTAPIDYYFGYKLGKLEYRTVRFETELLNREYYQPAAVVNYPSINAPFTRVIEHKRFNDLGGDKTIISREYSEEWSDSSEPYYPINDEKNTALYEEYVRLAEKETNVYFAGRLGSFRYADMDDTVFAALTLSKKLLN